MDSTAALKAGMSYGKWKALHPHTEMAVPEVTETGPKRPCRICGRELGRNGKLYCNDICAHEAAKARKREYWKRKKERMMENGKI